MSKRENPLFRTEEWNRMQDEMKSEGFCIKGYPILCGLCHAFYLVEANLAQARNADG